MSSIVIIGGGFTGASAAIQLLRRTPRKVDITIVEPKPHIGFGLAYSSDDPDHRLNAPLPEHFVDPLEPDAFQRWYSTQNLSSTDPGALASNGAVYARRYEYGRFIADTLGKSAACSKHGSSVRHVLDSASEAELACDRSGYGDTGNRQRAASSAFPFCAGALPSSVFHWRSDRFAATESRFP